MSKRAVRAATAGLPGTARAPAVSMREQPADPRLGRFQLVAFASIFVAAIVAIVSLMCTRFVSRGWNAAISELRELQEELLQRDRQSLHAYDQIYKELRENYALRENQRDAASLETLRQAEEFLQQYIGQLDGHPLLALEQAGAYFRLGHVSRDLRKLGQAEGAFRESRRLFALVPPSALDYESATVRAAASSRLSCLLASMGRSGEARALAEEVVDLLERWNASKTHPQQFDLALAHYNLGLLKVVQSQDGRQEMRRSIEISRQTVSAASEEDFVSEAMPRAVLLVDAQQVLMGMEWGAGDFAAAEAAGAASIETIKELNRCVQHITDFGYALPSLKFKKALAAAERNMNELRRDQIAVAPNSSDMAVAEPWQWRALNIRQGETVDHELLTHVRWPGEFERNDALMISWTDEQWCQDTVLRLAKAIQGRAPLLIAVEDTVLEAEARAALREGGIDGGEFSFLHVGTNSFWMRDYGPLVVITPSGSPRIVDAFYRDEGRFLDDGSPLTISRLLQVPTLRIPVELEWGGVACNGGDICLVSREILDWNVEKGFPERDLTRTFQRISGAKQVVYLEPMHDEPTHHLDVFATFTSPDTVVVGDYKKAWDARNHNLLNSHAERLAKLKTRDGKPLRVVRIPMPPRGDGYFGGSFTNVVFANGALIVPTSPQVPPDLEREALDTYRRLLPDWEVVGVESHILWTKHGGPHCATMNVPRLNALGQGSDS